MKKLLAAFFLFLSAALFLGDGKQSAIDVFGVVAIVCLFVVAQFFLKKQREVPFLPRVLWGATILYFIVRSVFSDDVGYSIYATVRAIDGFLLFYVFYCYSIKEIGGEFCRLVVNLSLFALAAAFLVSFSPLLPSLLPLMNLLTPSYGHNHIVDVLLFGLPIALFLSIKSRKYAYISGLLLLGSFFSFSRAAIIFAVGILASVFFVSRKQLSNSQKYVFAAAALGAALVSIFGLLLSGQQLTKISRQFPGSPRFDKQSATLNIRAEYWRQAVAAIEERPIFGSGPGTFFLQSKKFQNAPDSYSWFAHNFLLEWMVELGFVGTLPLLILLMWALKRADKKSPLLLGAVVLLVYGLVDFVLNYLVVWFLLWAALGFLVGTHNRSDNKFRKNYLVFICLGILLTFYLLSVVGYLGWKVALVINEVDAKKEIERGDYSEAIIWFHQQNPEVLYALAQKTRSDVFFQRAIEADGQNMTYINKYVDALLERGEKKQIGEFLLWASMRFSPTPKALLHQVRFTDDVMMSLYTEKLFQNVGSQTFVNEYLSKTHYFIGLELLSSDPERTRMLWTLARDLSPQWGYFHVELASLNYHVLMDKTATERILRDCLVFQFAKQQCSNTNINEIFPGSQYENIRAIPRLH